jgi:imidazolonepropionase-like amidohydrolase
VDAELLAAFDEIPDDPYGAPEMRAFMESLRSKRPLWLDNVQRLHRAGVAIMAGSDPNPGVFAGAGLHRELDLLHEAGLSSLEVIRAATVVPARFLAGDGPLRFGKVEANLAADILLVDGDPVSDLRAIHRIRAVIRHGVLL